MCRAAVFEGKGGGDCHMPIGAYLQIAHGRMTSLQWLEAVMEVYRRPAASWDMPTDTTCPSSARAARRARLPPTGRNAEQWMGAGYDTSRRCT